MTVPGNIKTRVTEDWQTTRLFFDMSYITSAGGDFDFDSPDDLYLDEDSNAEKWYEI
jgi:hypothetical protein